MEVRQAIDEVTALLHKMREDVSLIWVDGAGWVFFSKGLYKGENRVGVYFGSNGHFSVLIRNWDTNLEFEATLYSGGASFYSKALETYDQRKDEILEAWELAMSQNYREVFADRASAIEQSKMELTKKIGKRSTSRSKSWTIR